MTEVVAAGEFGIEALAACITAAFDGYIGGPVAMDAAALPRFLRRQGADLALSRAVVRDGVPMGIAIVGAWADPSTGSQRRRLCLMGVRREARGSGASTALLRPVMDEARAAGASSLELEVFVQNAPAVRLYRAAGFVDGPPLWGFSRAATAVAAPAGDVPAAVPIEAAAAWLLERAPRDLPYQVCGHALRAADPATQAWRLGDALLAFSRPADGRLVVGTLFDADPAQHDARRLLCSLIARHPAHAIHVPQLMRDDVAGVALREAGFETLPLHQMQMRWTPD